MDWMYLDQYKVQVSGFLKPVGEFLCT